jgi:hypothetical protein
MLDKDIRDVIEGFPRDLIDPGGSIIPRDLIRGDVVGAGLAFLLRVVLGNRIVSAPVHVRTWFGKRQTKEESNHNANQCKNN